jgi:hypothetical protein
VVQLYIYAVETVGGVESGASFVVMENISNTPAIVIVVLMSVE